MNVRIKIFIGCLFAFTLIAETSKSQNIKDLNKASDSVRVDSVVKDSLVAPVDTNELQREAFLNGGIDMEEAAVYPHASLQQMLKGNVAGVYVQEPSGEPGSQMSMFIRGTAIPLSSHKDIYNAQPTVIVDGVPLIMDHPFAFDIQLYDYNRLGPATNLLSSIDPNNIASIKVLKDFGQAAIYGPRAANGGVILIKTKAPVIGGRKISVNSYVGFAQRPHVYATNARFENEFRQPFYDRYASLEDILNYPLYLRDSTNKTYYGPADWTDLYYHNRLIRGIDASLSSGTERANFRFAFGNQQTKNPADNTKLDRYNAMFEINLVPVSWLTISSMITASRLERQRNSSLRDRFASVEYLPDLVNPLPANKEGYSRFLHELDKSFDDNKSNVITGFFKVNVSFSDALSFTSNFGFDYNEGLRDIFYPSTLMETVNYVSNYFGYNQRIMFNNTLRWNHNWNEQHQLILEGGEIFEADFNRYNYSYSYDGPNDLIKVNEVYSDPNKSNYLDPKAFPRSTSYMFLDKQRHRLLSFFGHAKYRYKDILELSALVRADGSSNVPLEEYLFISPTFALDWNIKNNLLPDNSDISDLSIRASWGRVGRLMTDDRFGERSQYVSDMSFDHNPVKFSYAGFSGLSRPYSLGYVGDIRWPYTDQLNIGADLSMYNNRIRFVADLYNKMDYNMLFKVLGAAEYGYSGVYKNGLQVRNRGVDLSLAINVLPAGNKLQWVFGANFNYNQNTLMALPGDLKETIIGKGEAARKLKVGHAIDQFWLLTNNGIYNRERDIPVDPQTKERLAYKGIPLNGGDPAWKDLNGDYTINDDDKIMTGHYLPKASGGFNSDFTYHNFRLTLSFYYALGMKILNKEAANHLDFVNREGDIAMDAIKEVTFWSKTSDYTAYPMYNPWSSVEPYRTDQDLFLEDGSFLKLRTVSLQYDMTKAKWWNKKSFMHKCLIYVTAGNLFTITPYSGSDPELAYFNGVDDGYGLPIPRTFTLGVKIDL